MSITRIITVTSAKGGVGKTFVTSNLATVLAKMRKKVAIVDCNFTTSHLALHFGMMNVENTINDVLRGDIGIEQAAHRVDSGLLVVPASIRLDSLEGIKINNLRDHILEGFSHLDFVLLDGAPGLGRESLVSMQVSDELVLVANPNMSSVLDVVKVGTLAEMVDKRVLGVVLNRVRNKPWEIKDSEIEYTTGMKVLAKIQEDENADRSIFKRDTLVSLYPHSKTASQFYDLAHFLSGEKPYFQEQSKLSRFFSGLKRKKKMKYEYINEREYEKSWNDESKPAQPTWH